MMDTNYNGHNVGRVIKTDTWEECSQKCSKEPECFGWSYAATGSFKHNCHFKNEAFPQGKVVSAGMISGTKGCGGYLFLKNFRADDIGNISTCITMSLGGNERLCSKLPLYIKY